MSRRNGEPRTQHMFETFFILGSAIFGSLAAARFNAFERFCAWARHYEIFQADELLVTALIFCIAFACLFLRRDSDLRRHLQSAEAARASALDAARTDELTGLPNRLGFREHATAIKANVQSISVLIIDLDGFKAVNDTWGHASGNEVLRCVGLRLRALLERLPGTYIARLGGDEFAVMVAANLCPKSPEQVADLIVKTVAAPLPGWANSCVQASVGVAFETDDVPLHELMRQADLAMYLAKTAGGGRYVHAARTTA